MATPFRLKRSAVADRRPTTTDLQLGELALNTHDGFLYAETTGVGSTVSLLTPWREQYGSPTSIYYNHRVGIGSTNPTVSLDVVGDVIFQSNLNVSGISTFGNNVIVENGSLEIKSVSPTLIFNDTTGTPDYEIRKQSGHLMIMETTQTNDTEWRLSIRNGGTIDIPGDLDVHGDLDVDGHTELDNLNVSGVSTFIDTVNVNGVIEANSNVNVDGNLDVDGHTELDNLRVSGISTFSDDIIVGVGATVGFGTTAYFRDNARAVFGNGEDLSIYHDGEQSYLSDQGTGGFRILTSTFRVRNPGDNATFISAANSYVSLFHDGDQRLKTTEEGVLVSGGTTTGTLNVTGIATVQSNLHIPDDSKILMGDSNDFRIYHNPDNSLNYIVAHNNGPLLLRSSNADMIHCSPQGAVTLKHDGGTRAATSPTGFDVSGTLNVTGVSTFTGEIDANDNLIVAGNIGIGTDIPKQKLEVFSGAAGRPTFRHTGGFGGLQIAGPQPGSGAALMFARSYDVVGGGLTAYSIQMAGNTQGLHFISGDPTEISTKTRLFLNSAGSIGINTSNPRQKFHLDNGIMFIRGDTAPSIRINAAINDTSSTRLMFGLATGANNFFNGAQALDACLSAPSTGRLLFGVGVNSRMYIVNSGDVTIARPTPLGNAKLSVQCDTGSEEGIAVNLNQNSGISTAFAIWNNTGSEVFNLAQDTDSTPDLIFKIKGSGESTPVEKVRFASDGKVGIGTDNPDSKLHVSSTDNIVTTIERSGNSDGARIAFVDRYTTTSSEAFVEGYNGELHLGAFGESMMVFTSANGGRVGIGTDAPDVMGPYFLQIYGSTQVNDNFKVTGISTFTGLVKLPDSTNNQTGRLMFGGGSDLQIFHTGSAGEIGNFTGNLNIKSNGFRVFNGAANQSYIIADQNSSVSIAFSGTNKLSTTGYGVTVFGTTETQTLNVTGISTFTGQVGFETHITLPDHARLKIGTHEDIQIYNKGNLSIIANKAIAPNSNNNQLHIHSFFDLHQSSAFSQYFKVNNSSGAENHNGGDDALKLKSGAGVEAYYDGEKRFETTTYGALLTGGASGIGTLAGPAIFHIDPTTVGDNTGTVVIKGNLQIDGTTTTVNSTTVTVDDKNLVLASGAANDAAASGGGITIESGDGNKTFTFESTGNGFQSSEHFRVASGKVIGFAAHTGTFLSASASGGFVFTIGNNEKARIRSSGDVNLGANLNVVGVSTFSGDVHIGGATITNPSGTSLDFSGSITASDVVTAGALLHEGDTDTLVHFSAADTIDLKTFSVARLRVNNSGVSLQNNTTFNTNGGRIILGDSTGGTGDDRIVLGNSDDCFIYHDSSNTFIENNTGILKILGDTIQLGDGTDKVGINSTSPTHELEVLGDSSLKGNLTVSSISTQSTHTNKALQVRNNSDTNTFAVSYRGQLFASSVGIGTAVPGAPLHISGADANAARMLIEDNNNGFAASELRVQNGGRDLRIAAPVDIFFQKFNISTPVLYLENGNAVGIRTDNPSATLDVFGSTKLRGGVEIDGHTELDNLNVAGVSTFQSNIILPDGVSAKFGTDLDGEIKHTGFNLQIQETTGNIQIINYGNDRDVDIKTDDGSGGTALYFKADGSTGESILYNYGSEKIKTTSSGINVTGNVVSDGLVVDGNSDLNGDLDVAGISTLGSGASGSVDIQHQGSTKLVTQSWGIDVSGVIQGETAIQCHTNATGALAKTTHGLIHGQQKQAIFQFNSVDDKIYLINNTSDKEFALLANDSGDVGWKVIPDGAVELYHNDVKRFETTNSGVGISSNLTVSGISTFTGDIKIQTSDLSKSLLIGDIAGTPVNYLGIQQVAGSSIKGFATQYNNASVFENLQGSIHQHLVLGDSNYDDSNTIFGISITDSGTTYERLKLTGVGDLTVARDLNVTRNLDVDGKVLIGTDTEGHPNADDLTIATSGDTGITIRSGTTNDGRIYFSDATSGAGEYAGSLHYDHNDNKFIIFTDGESRLIIDSSGRLLLGTDTEGHPNADDLTIATDGDTGITIRSGASHNGRIYFSDATSGTGEVVGSLDYDHNIDKFSIFTNNQPRFHIDSSGNVGINSGLTVSGISTFSGAIDANGNLDVDGQTDLDDLAVAGISTFSDDIFANGQVAIGTDIVPSYGNLFVGVHTNTNAYNSSPTARFAIEPASSPHGDASSIHFGQRAGGSSDPSIIFHRRSGDVAWKSWAARIYQGSLDSFKFGFAAAALPGSHSFSDEMVIKRNIGVGIGTHTPRRALDVIGDSVLEGNLNVAGITTSTGVINSQTDIRINNVSVIETALNDAVAMAIALG